MKGHHAALLLLGIFVLWMEPISARIMRISHGNLHNETEASEDEITLKSSAPSVEAFRAPVRPVKCPRQTLPGLPHPNQAYCIEGQPCPGDEKCCRVGNIVKCVLPVGVHRGYCPWAERAVASSKSCSWDTDCALDEKCCPIERHQSCAKAMLVNPGLCPKKPLPPVSFTCKNRCEDDRSCFEDQKCCFVDCGLKCIPPESQHISGDQVELDRDEDAPLPDGDHGEPPRPGTCARQTFPGLPRPIQAYCMEDKPCPGDEKCCRVGNIMKCILPVGVHPGYCPFVESGAASSESCSWDTNCALDEKCCPIEGHPRCAKAVPANPGLCPKKLIPRIVVPCEDECEDDQSCLEGQKCCFVICGLKCVPPERHPSGDQMELDRDLDPEGDHKDVCLLPPESRPCNGRFSRFFFNSTSGKCEKFIYGGCGGNANNFLTKEKCLQVCSGEEKEGLCPARSPPGAIDPCFGKCLNDSQCAGKMKCCKIECGMACLEPVSEKEGTCPAITPSCLLSPFFIQCFRDSQCPARMKCCHAACRMVCLDPIPEPPRPGECPNPTLSGLPRLIQSYCLEDKPCPGEEKCCRVGNIMKCILPFGVHRGYCPRNEGDENGIKICSWDTDCALDKKCCPSEGPQRCIKPVPANPGLCPKKVLPLVLTPCKDKCRDDQSCPKGQKCCFIDCGLKCVPPASHHRGDQMEMDVLGDAFSLEEDHGAPARPGACPRQAIPGLPHPIQAYCVEDKPCPGDEKCCRVGNIVKCVLPLGVHPGYCPRRKSDETSAKNCSWDTDCAKDEKCCPSKGHQRCTQAVPANSGLCPKKALPPVSTPCKDKCRDDQSCPEGQKCCFVDCGLKCVPPESPHSRGQQLDQDEDAPLLDGGHGDVCLLPSDQGYCDAHFPRFFYNSTSGKCEKFIYGGCGGNANNFVTKEKCLRVCAGEDVCLLLSDQGDCDAHIPRFFYNSATGECEMFIYGGCGGNENNFLNKEECLQVCSGKEKEGVWRAIILLGEPDNCFTRCSKKRSYPSWWKFCQTHCAVACVEPQPDYCLLPPNPGDCLERSPRFFYNPAARRCQKFVYTGCGGNKNNFHTNEDCLRVCAHIAPRKPGMCPNNPLHGIPHNSQAYCMDDSACPGHEKCCQIGNIAKCVLPLEATHPGYCPSNGSAAASSLHCIWDTDCSSDEKCCPSQEHKRCTKAVSATLGSCPKKCLPWVFARCANKCKDDRSCPDGYKCCFSECGLRCVLPEEPPAGQQMELDQDQALLVPEMDLGEREDTCPLASALDEPNPCLHLFSLQTRCPRKWRYCQIDYGVPGLELQPDYCLLRPEPGNCPSEVTRFFYDSVTRKCKKISSSGCGANENNFLTSTECLRVCEGAVTPKPGDCPRKTFPEYQPLTYDYCFEDAACPGEEKCCRVGTIRKCFLLQGVHHGYCPEKKDVAASSKSCSWDTHCAMDEKCCPSEQRKRCTKAVPEKPGLCPMQCFARVFSRCKNECKDDRSCPEDKKCCFADCGLKCVPAVDRHGGHWTAVNGNCGAHLLMAVGECPKPQGLGICVEECTGDESCGPGEKCCSNGCGHVCTKVTGVLPARVVGECPKPQGLGICVEECAGDEFCGPGEKCCSNGCGHVCLKVFPDFCQLPSDSGSCNATSVLLRFFYNSQSGRCEKFPYKGCGGNKNNFATHIECLQACSDREICRLPVDQGWGDALRTRFFYNSKSRTCESFFYRGHRGNANNFWEKEDCLRFCVVRAETEAA